MLRISTTKEQEKAHTDITYEKYKNAILSAMGIPKEILGDVSNTSRANAREAHLIFMERTILQKVKQLLPMLNMAIQYEGSFIKDEIDFIDPLPEIRK